MGSQRAVVLLLLCLMVAGCAVNLHGKQSVASSASTTTLASSVSAGAGAGQAGFSASFGSPPPPGATGGQVGFSRGAAALLVLGLVIAETTEFFGSQFRSRPAAGTTESSARTSISETCSCYGWRPESAAALE